MIVEKWYHFKDCFLFVGAVVFDETKPKGTKAQWSMKKIDLSDPTFVLPPWESLVEEAIANPIEGILMLK